MTGTQGKKDRKKILCTVVVSACCTLYVFIYVRDVPHNTTNVYIYIYVNIMKHIVGCTVSSSLYTFQSEMGMEVYLGRRWYRCKQVYINGLVSLCGMLVQE